MSETKKICSLEEKQTFCASFLHNRFWCWKGRDVWHQDLNVQIRLDPDGSVYLSTQEGHVSTLRTASISLEQLHATIRAITAPSSSSEAPPPV